MQEREKDKRKSQLCCVLLQELCKISTRLDMHKLHNFSTTSQHFLKYIHKHKRGTSAKGSTLLPLALRPRLFDVVINSKKVHSLKIVSNFAMLFLITVTTFTIQNFITNNAYATSLTLEVPTAISLDITPSTSGTFAKSTASNFSMKTDAPWGYNLTIKGKSTDISLTNGSSKLTSITGNLTEDQFKAGASNTWGYLPSKVDGSINTTFRPGPSITATTIDKTSAKNDTANNYSIILGAKVDDKVIAGEYTNSFILTSTANTVSYNITYNLNSGTWSGTSPQTGNTTASTITLDSHTPTKSNHTFKGWCTSSSITNNNTTSTPTCTGTAYQPGGTYNLSNGSNTVTMYAMWQQNGTSYSIAYNCNSGTPCPSTQTGTTTSTNVTLSSTTPSKSGYTFQGWCSTSPSSNNTTSVSCSGYTYQPNGSYPLSRGASVTLYAMWKESMNKGNLGNMQSFTCSKLSTTESYGTVTDTRDNKTYSIAKLADGKCWMTQNLNYTGNSSYTQSQYGAYYSWQNAQSACPSGWRLPNNSEFNSLLSAYGNNSSGQLLKSPANFVLSGYYVSGSFYGAGRSGVWWSSDSSHNYLELNATNGFVNINGSDNSRYFSVRCVSSR